MNIKNVFGGVSVAVSIRDVAKAAGVTVGTVSRAFNDYSDIREETKQMILATAKELGYIPNLNAKRLSGKTCQTMAIILSGFLADRGLTDELVIKMLRGACQYADSHDVEFAVYVISSQQQKDKSYEQFCNEHSLAGAMCFGLRTTDAYYEHLKCTDTPCVIVDILMEGENTGFVGTDDRAAFGEMTELVLSNNHKKILFLNGRQDAEVCEQRLEGLQNALAKHGMELEKVYYTDFNAENAQAIVSQYIARNGTQQATAIMCASDLIALGACKAIQKSGYQVGKDFSVTGFDGLHIANLIEPSITTIDQNMEQKGYAAAEMLHAIVEGRQTSKRRMIPYSLIRTDSVAYVE